MSTKVSTAQTGKYPVFRTVIAQLSLSITAGIYSSLLFHSPRPEVSDFIFNFLHCLGSVLMDQISQNVLKPGISFPQGSAAAVYR